MLEPLLDDEIRLVDPMVVVDLDKGPVPDIGGLVDGGRVVVGITTAGCTDERLDLVLAQAEDHATAPASTVTVPEPRAEAARLRAATEANPQATLVLAALLRATERLSLDAALDMESLAYSTLLGGAEFRRWLGVRGAPRLAHASTGAPVLLAREDDTLRLSLNRPERRNAFGREVRDALVEGLRVALLDPQIARVMLDGAGPVFCSGGDLDEFGTTPDPVTAHFLRTYCGAARLLHRIADRTTVRLHGPCVGAGVELPAFAGRVEAARGTTFRLPELDMGLLPGAGGTVSLPRRIGRQRTLHLALSGRPLDLRTALSWGLVDSITPNSSH